MTMFDVDTTIKDLEKTISVMGEHPWTQGKNFGRSLLGSTRMSCCAWGAVLLATSEDGHEAGQMDRASSVARVFYRQHSEDIVAYNDAEGRTRDQVIQALQATLDTLKTRPSLLTAKKEDDK